MSGVTYAGGMPRVTAAYRERQTDRILQAAEGCFARNGFQATSMDEVIAAAGMSSSTVYRYFPEGKRSLIRAVLTRRMGPLVERIKRIAESEEPLDFERDFIEALTLLNYQRHGAAAGSEADRQDDAHEAPGDVGLLPGRLWPTMPGGS